MKLFLRENKQIVFLLGALAVIYAVMVCLNTNFAFSLINRTFKYAGVSVCFLTAVAAYKVSFNRDDAKLLVWALLFTLVSDALLLFASAPELGVLSFLIVHLLYIRRYKKKSFKRNLILALAAASFSAAGFWASFSFPYILLLGAVYAVFIFTSTILAFRSNLPPINKRLAEIGMVLFLLCDLNVAISFLAQSGSLVQWIAGNLEWIFYIPSQALLALSAAGYGSRIPKSIRLFGDSVKKSSRPSAE